MLENLQVRLTVRRLPAESLNHPISLLSMPQFNDGTYEIIGCAMHVHRSIGSGLRERPYRNALMIALRRAGMACAQQHAYPIIYEGVVVGDCIPDITVITADVLVEIKSIPAIGESERAQMLNYLRISGKLIGLIINFRNPSLEWERVVRST